ncbi:MAG: GNAT family N-acetyltransferase [Bacteroidota bacterium]|nr:GNAT family N-acetyltransferase [Bacteroidota bacterium]
MILLKRTNSDDTDFHMLVQKLDKDLAARYGTLQAVYDQYNKIEDLSTIVIAYQNDEPMGCGCFKKFEIDSVEVKRMYVTEGQRGKGTGRAILAELEKWAAELGYAATVLELGNNQPEAIRLYRAQGYEVIPNYGPYIGMATSICMKKALALLTTS